MCTREGRREHTDFMLSRVHKTNALRRSPLSIIDPGMLVYVFDDFNDIDEFDSSNDASAATDIIDVFDVTDVC
jgi:hypothetical protein